jgi:hypothetical protein
MNTSVKMAAPLVALSLVALWAVFLNILARDMYGAGIQSFVYLVILCDLLLVAKIIRPLPVPHPSIGLQTGICAVCLLASGYFVAHHIDVFRHFYGLPAGSDYSADTWTAARHEFDLHENPYATKSQLMFDPTNAPHVTNVDGQLRMFGVPYYFGYTYFPAMFITYEPFRHIVPSVDCIRVANAAFYLAIMGAAAWLVALFAPSGSRVIGVALVLASLACVYVLGKEIFDEGATDAIIPMFALYGIIAAYYKRPTLSGILFGWAFACKLMPGAFLCLIIGAWYWRRPERWKFWAPMVITFVAVVVPHVLRNPPAFLSATILYFLTEHAKGDDTALYYFVPAQLQSIYLILGYGLVLWLLIRSMRRKEMTLLGVIGSCFVTVVLFIAFSKMDHDNYLLAIWPFGCIALISYALRGSQESSVPGSSVQT